MKRLNLLNWKFFSVVLFSGIFFSCSKDDKDPVISKTIESVEIWSVNNNYFAFNSNLSFAYNSSGRLAKFSKDNLDPEVTYVYNGNNEIEYNWRYGQSGSPLFYGYQINAQLQNGRTERTESSELGTFRYSYNEGYVINNDQRRDKEVIAEYSYSWKKGNLEKIQSLEDDVTYNDTFTASSIPNEYNLDLNVLPHFVDKRYMYVEKMNSFGQLIGIIGKRSQNFLQNSKYSYEYSYDEYGRLFTITMKEKAAANGEGYLFKIYYN